MTIPALFAGTSGWAYSTWKPDFYPAEVASRGFLEHYAGRLNSVEVNYTFRATVSAAQLDGWLNATPENFRFSFKAPATVTHMRRLRDCDTPLQDFLASLAPVVESGKNGAILLQFPPNFRAAAAGKDRQPNAQALQKFLRDTQAVRQSSKWQFAAEFRDPSWFSDDVYQTLREHNLALCIAESDELSTPQIQTADFCYARLRASGYAEPQLEAVIRDQMQLAAERTAYAYFKHEDAPDGPLRAEKMLDTWRAQSR